MDFSDKKITGQWFAVLFCLLAPLHLDASNSSFLKYGLVADFTQSDLQQLQKAYQHALNNNKPGDIHSWVGGQSENGGKITVMKQYRQKENVCKRLKFNNYTKRQTATTYYNFCLIDEQWVLVN